ncbi:hypothetical protein ACIRQH_34705 [Streptomyces sp. NPDC102279]|uniref:hypothetical protein n=1 Tax=Streptomyces sp. NPDC102279 TaxID=3366153 RepID=UPI0037FDFB35
MLSAHGAIRDSGARAAAGAALAITALFAVLVSLAHRWMTDTRAEHGNLARARERTEEERATYIALKAANEAEAMRMQRDFAAERAQNAAALAAERVAMYAKLEEERLQIEGKGFQTGVLFERAGMLEPEPPKRTNLIPFPAPAPGADPQPERTREHGVVGP